MTAKRLPKCLTQQEADYIRKIAENIRHRINCTEESYKPKPRKGPITLLTPEQEKRCTAIVKSERKKE